MTNAWAEHPPRRILLATDLSARCDRALDRAAALARVWGSELLVVHATELAPDALFDSRDGTPGSDDPRSKLERRARSEIGEVLPNVPVVIEHGDPAEVILRVAQGSGADLIVTGLARYEPLGRLVLGSTVDKLLGKSPIPVLVVRRRGRKPYHNVVTATDFSQPSRQALEVALRAFPNATHAVFHAYDEPYSGQFQEAAAQAYREFLAASDLSAIEGRLPRTVLEYGQPDQLLFEYVQQNDVDLVVMGTRGRGALHEIFIGSVAKRLVMSLPCDTLLVRPEEFA